MRKATPQDSRWGGKEIKKSDFETQVHGMPTYVVESQPHIHINGKGQNRGGGVQMWKIMR